MTQRQKGTTSSVSLRQESPTNEHSDVWKKQRIGSAKIPNQPGTKFVEEA
jgi:hypothetical protein